MKHLLILLIISIPAYSDAQVFSQSANPPNIKWRQIKNYKSQIIFPSGMEQYAIKFASTLDYIEKNKKSSIGPKALNIPVILHGQSMNPNGFVASIPFRSEIYPTPLANWNLLGPNEWETVLAIHEYRHVLQSSNSTVGFTKLFRFLGGRTGWAGSMVFTSPNWFAEGDAVLSETLQTEGGRGRLPSFSEQQRANFYVGNNFTFMKARNGSYKSVLASHYPFGYQLNLYARKHFGNNIWSNVVNDANKYKSIFYPFSGAIKRNMGLSSKKLYLAAYKDFKEASKENLLNTTLIPFHSINESDTKEAIYYTFPNEIESGEIIARKSSYKETPHLVKIDENGNELKLVDIGISQNAYLSYAQHGAMWIEAQTNPRWANVNSARVAFYDWNKQEKKYLLENKRVYYAAVDFKAEEFVTVDFSDQLQYSIHRYNLENGQEIGLLENRENWAIAYPMYDKEENYLYYMAKKEGRIALIKHDLTNGVKTLLTNWENHVMAEPSQSSSYVYFKSDFSGIDNIYAVSKSGNKRIIKVSSVPVAASHSSISQNDSILIFSNLTSTGKHLGSMTAVLDQKNEMNLLSPQLTGNYGDVNALSENGSILNEIPTSTYDIKPYNNFFRGWKLHSWGINGAFTTEEGEDAPSVSSGKAFVLIDDILGANSLEFSYTRYFNDNENGYGANYSMGKYFAKLNLGYQFRGRSLESSKGNRVLHFQEQEVLIGLSVPLEMIKGNYTWNTNLAANWKGIQQFKTDDFDNSKFGLYEIKGSATFRRQKAYQNLRSRYGGGLSLKYAKSFVEGYAEIMNLDANLFLPGIGKNHSLELQQAYQEENPDNIYQFPDEFSYGRGHQLSGFETSHRSTINYRFPLLYPDIGIEGITFLKRIRCNLYFDHARVYDGQIKTNLQSLGAELRFDQTLMNLIDLPVGIRVGYRIPNDFLPDLTPVFVNFIIGG